MAYKIKSKKVKGEKSFVVENKGGMKDWDKRKISLRFTQFTKGDDIIIVHKSVEGWWSVHVTKKYDRGIRQNIISGQEDVRDRKIVYKKLKEYMRKH